MDCFCVGITVENAADELFQIDWPMHASLLRGCVKRRSCIPSLLPLAESVSLDESCHPGLGGSDFPQTCTAPGGARTTRGYRIR